MYAVFIDGGRQYKVVEGERLEIDFREVEAGKQITFDRVVALSGGQGLKIGTPVVSGASVTAKVVGPSQGPKIVVQKFRRRKNMRRRTGHRQLLTTVEIEKIQG
jgi:large subunit ribosomal protein L21